MPQRFLLLLPAFLLCCSFSKPVEANPIFIPISSRALIEPYSEDDFMGDIAPLQPQKVRIILRIIRRGSFTSLFLSDLNSKSIESEDEMGLKEA